jgi:hypothetical protein
MEAEGAVRPCKLFYNFRARSGGQFLVEFENGIRKSLRVRSRIRSARGSLKTVKTGLDMPCQTIYQDSNRANSMSHGQSGR